jgi:aminoglycoside 6'-N-acetyltransferase
MDVRKQSYSFRPVTVDDLTLLRRWQSTPHVGQWWDADDPFDDEELTDDRVSRWIVSLADRPFAYMQDYSVHGWGEHHFDQLPARSRGIDQYIGEVDLIDKGHGGAFIGQRMADLFRLGTPVIATDPHPENARAIAVYRKLGFEVVGPARQTEWGFILPMVARRARQQA